MERLRAAVYVMTRPPVESYQERALEVLGDYDTVEVRFNSTLHAKLYACMADEMSESFAMLGSGNLSGAALVSNIELGVMFLGRGRGREAV